MKARNTLATQDLAAIRAKLNGVHGQRYWQSLDEIAETPEFREMLHREFPDGASEWEDGLSRRSFLKMAAASLALAGLTACTKQPVKEILPYVKQPELLVLGDPLFYATTMQLGGYATGALGTSREGHPVKVDGNPEHPTSLGASSIWLQASIMDLYDPDRSQAFWHNGNISTWSNFISELNQLVHEHEADKGAGLRFLTETVTSPTLIGQFDEIAKRFPQAKFHQFDSISRDNVREGAQLAFGEMVETHYRFEQPAVILSLDSDFLYTHPQRLRYTRDFTDGRRVSEGKDNMNRLYVIESTPTVTGSMADHRFPLASAEIENVARELAQHFGVTANPQSSSVGPWLSAIIHDLENNRGKTIVVAGEWQPPTVHAICHLLNDKLGNVGKTVFYAEPVEFRPQNQLKSLRELMGDIKSGGVKTLFILGANPAYTMPADFDFTTLLTKIPRSIYIGTEFDDTAALCTWHVPQAHYLESWGDARSFDGTVSLQQPLILPLYGGKTVYEILEAMFRQQPIKDDYEVVHEHWRGQNEWTDFEKEWRRAICDGFVANTSVKEKTVSLKADAILDALAREKTGGANSEPTIELVFRPDASVWDGRFANNGWLQECPKPISKLTWDNAVIVGPALADRNQFKNNDVVELELNGRILRGPIWIQPGQAENTVTLHLGYGRRKIGRVGTGVGFNVNSLRTSDTFWSGNGLKMTKTGEQHLLVATQTHHNLQSPERQIFRETTLDEFRRDPQSVKKSVESPPNEETLYDTREYKYDGYKWAMSIDLTTCIGCNACLMACNAENNVPVVGKEQIHKNREMHWIRIDTYYQGSLDQPELSHMPVPCMHCEHAPCELVCPVEATVHDHEGLNLQVYNRCVGTRFCSNNCPYKVRRFNFHFYADYQTPSFKPMYNPDVTVRWRGVMEKCTYCIQRISRTRISAEKENRRIRAGEIQTACQQACPANAIVFGDLNAPDSHVAKLKTHPLDYSMLGELNTRPRTTYLAKLRNRNSQIENRGPA